jgi:polynucleotide 5'-kinase involved in rRNA processing
VILGTLPCDEPAGCVAFPAAKAQGDGEESFVLFFGSKQSGKTTLVTQFLNPTKEVQGFLRVFCVNQWHGNAP